MYVQFAWWQCPTRLASRPFLVTAGPQDTGSWLQLLPDSPDSHRSLSFIPEPGSLLGNSEKSRFPSRVDGPGLGNLGSQPFWEASLSRKPALGPESCLTVTHKYPHQYTVGNQFTFTTDKTTGGCRYLMEIGMVAGISPIYQQLRNGKAYCSWQVPKLQCLPDENLYDRDDIPEHWTHKLWLLLLKYFLFFHNNSKPSCLHASTAPKFF